ncbi:MAG: copper resistance CopC family protein [Ornithinimicrobium sp.]
MSHVRFALGWCAAILGAALILIGSAGTASAHDELTDTTPQDGAELTDDVGEVRLEFSGAIADVGSVVEVSGPEGDAAQGEVAVDGNVVVQPLASDLGPGDYSVRWRVTSQDGHPISGQFGYTLAPEEAPATSAEPSTQEPDSPDADGATTTSPEVTDSDQQTVGTDHAADTAAAPAQGDDSSESGPPWWVWGVLALAVGTLGVLGSIALRRR